MRKMIEEQSDTKQFYKILCANSQNKNPRLAILEWDYLYSFEEENHCICGMKIIENCKIINKHNNKVLIVGNICINKFLKKNFNFIFKGIRAVKENKTPNKTFIDYCFSKNYINQYEHKFLIDRFRKKKHTTKQKQFKEKILFKLSRIEKY